MPPNYNRISGIAEPAAALTVACRLLASHLQCNICRL